MENPYEENTDYQSEVDSTGLSDQEPINKYKENRASGNYPEEATYYGTIEDYEKTFYKNKKD